MGSDVTKFVEFNRCGPSRVIAACLSDQSLLPSPSTLDVSVALANESESFKLKYCSTTTWSRGEEPFPQSSDSASHGELLTLLPLRADWTFTTLTSFPRRTDCELISFPCNPNGELILLPCEPAGNELTLLPLDPENQVRIPFSGALSVAGGGATASEGPAVETSMA